MESSKALCLVVFVVAFLVTSSAGGRGDGLMGFNDFAEQGIYTLEGLMGFNDLAEQGDGKNKYIACCDSNHCTDTIPPKCHCKDVGTTCHAACKKCKCTKSHPHECRCEDITHYSYGRCTCSAANNI